MQLFFFWQKKILLSRRWIDGLDVGRGLQGLHMLATGAFLFSFSNPCLPCSSGFSCCCSSMQQPQCRGSFHRGGIWFRGRRVRWAAGGVILLLPYAIHWGCLISLSWVMKPFLQLNDVSGDPEHWFVPVFSLYNTGAGGIRCDKGRCPDPDLIRLNRLNRLNQSTGNLAEED